eukprot:gene790-9040_t
MYQIEQFPDEIYEEIIQFSANLKTLSSISLVSKKFHFLSNKKTIFKNLISQEYNIHSCFGEDPKEYFQELKNLDYPFKGKVAQSNSVSLFDEYILFERYGSVLIGKVVWSITGYPEAVTEIEGTVVGNRISFVEVESSNKQIAMIDTSYDCILVDNIFLIGVWSVSTLYGGILNVLDEFRIDSKKYDCESQMTKNSYWEGYGTLLKTDFLQIASASMRILVFEKDAVVLEIFFEQKKRRISITIEEKRDNFIIFEEDSSFIEIFNGYVVVGIDTVSGPMELFCFKNQSNTK